MLGILFLILCFAVGWAISSYAFPNLISLTEQAYNKKKISVSPYLLLLPVFFLIGTLGMTWATYLIALAMQGYEAQLTVANMIVMPLGVIFFGLVFYRRISTHRLILKRLVSENRKAVIIELFLLAGICILALLLMWTTFYIKYNKLYVGITVFSDFSPHIGMIRSFSYGNNFPTAYLHYAGDDIKYHFMFQFLVGNLEFLGMPIDYAFNIPSMLSFISAFLMIYILAVKLTTSKATGILACLFFAFRSSKTLFTYLSRRPRGTGILEALINNKNFIGSTPHEDWGLWNLNVYSNQRHLAFGLALVFFAIIVFLPHLYETFERIRKHRDVEQSAAPENKKEYVSAKICKIFQLVFLTKEGWRGKAYRQSIVMGILLGGLAFFHGSAVIGGLLILFAIAIMSGRRTEFIFTAVIAVLLASLQSFLFIHGAAVRPQFMFGFIAEYKTFFGAAAYLDRLLGILPLIILAAFCKQKSVGRYVMLAFLMPLIFAFTVSLTVDVTVNHKYIMMGVILMGVYAAEFLYWMLRRKDIVVRIVGVLLIFAMTSTGMYDFITLLRKNTTPNSAIVLDMQHPLTDWIKKNSDSKDIFLTSNYFLNQVVFSGAMLYQGWQYYAWSAGYDTLRRDRMVKLMYEASTPYELHNYVKKENIRFIIVDRDNRESQDYEINEENIMATYQSVYWEGADEWKLTIYDTRLPLPEELQGIRSGNLSFD